MIVLPANTPVNARLIDYCMQAFGEQQRRMAKLRDYYQNKGAIRQRVMPDDTLPNNRLAHAFARYISNVATAYFMGKGLRYETADKTYKARLDELLDGSDTRNFEAAKEMSIGGIAYELMYIDKAGAMKFHMLRADQAIPVYADEVGRFLSLAIRVWEQASIDAAAVKCADVYTPTEIVSFRCSQTGGWVEVGRRAHLMSDVPLIVRRNNGDCKGDFEDVISLIDAYDRAQSDTMNDLDYFTDAYLAVYGIEEIVEEPTSEVGIARQQKVKAGLRQRRTLFLPEGGEVKFITKDINDAATENFKDRLYRDIFFLAQVPNLTDEQFAGNLSGVALKYKLFGIEELSAEKEKYWKSAERKKLKLLTEHINTRYGTQYDYKTVSLSFDRSQIANRLELAQIMASLRGILSHQSIIAMWPDVLDAAEELATLQAERAREESATDNLLMGRVF